MRFTRIDLSKFGMFTDTTLDLLADGVNVIVGANEAGKTTAMAAIQQLLYGIPLRSEHSYLHQNADLRIGTVVRGNEGTELEFARIKRNAATLRSAADTPLSDDILAALLGGVGAELYQTLFSISHEEIVKGGQELLRSEGELGRALFGAGTGLTQLNSVMAKLDSLAGKLFKSGASKPLINAGLAGYKDLQAQVKELSTSSARVEDLNKAIKKAEANLRGLEDDFGEVSSQLNRAVRVRASQAQVRRRRKDVEELAELDAAGPRVSAEIPALLAAAQQARLEGATSLPTLEPDLQQLDEKLAGLDVDELLLAQTSVIEALVQEIGGLRQNFKDLPGLNKQVGDLERDLEGLLRRIPTGCRVDADVMPKISDVERARIERLSGDRGGLDAKLETTRAGHAEADEAQAKAVSHLESLSRAADVALLRSAFARIRADGPLEAKADQIPQQIAELVSKIEVSLHGIGLTVAPRLAEKLVLPASARVSEVDTAVNAAQLSLKNAQETEERLRDVHAGLEDELAGLLRRSDPPSLDDLGVARSRREQGWRFVRTAWLDGRPMTSDEITQWGNGAALETAYESSVTEADDVADRLRSEAEAVERRALLEQQLDSKNKAMEQQLIELEAKHREVDAALVDWRALFEPLGLTAGSRADMDAALDKARACGNDAATLRQLDADLQMQLAAISRHITDLRGLLLELGDHPADALSLAALLDRAEAMCSSADDAQKARSLAEQALDASKAQLAKQNGLLEAAEGALEAWAVDWAAAVGPLGVPTSTPPIDVAPLLVTLSRIDATADDLDEKRRRVEGIERRNGEVADRVAGVLDALPHLALDREATEATINSLQRLLHAAEKNDATRSSLRDQQADKARAVEQARESVTKANAIIGELLHQCGLADEQALVDAVGRTQKADTLADSINDLETQVINATGMALADVEREVDECGGLDLETALAELTRRHGDLDTERGKAQSELGRIRAELTAIDDSDQAAAAAEQAQVVLADVANHTDEYVRVMVAKYLLEQEIADYRARNQGPIIGRASETFTRLTLGKYSGIDTDVDDKGQPVILAKRSSAGSLDVSSLSTGARDQLYLSLRIAALEHYAKGNRNLPLLLDDLFVHFDDGRTSAGLQLLEELSESMQVLLFTHHERVAEQAASAIAPEKLKVLRLTA